MATRKLPSSATNAFLMALPNSLRDGICWRLGSFMLHLPVSVLVTLMVGWMRPNSSTLPGSTSQKLSFKWAMCLYSIKRGTTGWSILGSSSLDTDGSPVSVNLLGVNPSSSNSSFRTSLSLLGLNLRPTPSVENMASAFISSISK